MTNANIMVLSINTVVKSDNQCDRVIQALVECGVIKLNNPIKRPLLDFNKQIRIFMATFFLIFKSKEDNSQINFQQRQFPHYFPKKTIPKIISKEGNFQIKFQRRRFPNYFPKKTSPKLIYKEDNSQINFQRRQSPN